MTKRHAEDAAVALHYDLVSVICAEFSMKEALASYLAEVITRGLRARLGGQEIYVPAPDKRDRDEAIRREFNGTNLAEVCRRYGVSKSRLYEIVAASGVRRRERVGRLPVAKPVEQEIDHAFQKRPRGTERRQNCEA